VGQWVLAVGNPYGLDGTVSFGIVSAKGRNLEIPNLLNDFVQTDAMIDRGSSGGPLVDLQGRVIGINSRGQGRGIGFTIPVETALEVMRQLQKGGIERGWLGVTVQPLDRDLAAYLEIPDTTGVVVNSVTAGSPAARAGIETGDVVTSFAGARIEAEEEEDLGAFQRQVARLEPGQRAQVEVLREGKPRRLEIEIGAQPKIQPDEVESDFGFQVQEITQDLFREQRLGVREGAYVFFVAGGSPAAEAGLLPGDVIQSVDRKSVETLQDFERVMDALGGKERVLVTARRGDETKFLLLKKGAKPAGPSSSEDDAGEAAEKHPREEGKPSQP
jgi:S1-C subfamily serine protease